MKKYDEERLKYYIDKEDYHRLIHEVFCIVERDMYFQVDVLRRGKNFKVKDVEVKRAELMKVRKSMEYYFKHEKDYFLNKFKEK